MSSSAARIAANRRNAQKSTGPRTEEGKHRISRNAVTHGLTAQTLCLDEESSPAFHTLRRRMLEDLAPQGEIECQLAEQMIAARWRLMRLWETETDLYNCSLESIAEPAPSGDPDSPGEGRRPAIRRRTLAFTQLSAAGDLEKLSRYENRISRDYDRCLRRLRELKADRLVRRDRGRDEHKRLPEPVQHSDLLTADEYIRLERKENYAPEPLVQNKPNAQSPALPPSSWSLVS